MLSVENKQRIVFVRIAKKVLLVVLLLILIEVLYLHVDSGSWRAGESICYAFSFPFRSVDYGIVTGEMGPISENEWVFGLKADPILLVIDILVVLFLGLMLVRCVPTVALVAVVEGCVLGSVTGSALSWLAEVSPESLVSWAVAVIVMFALVPLTIYMLSLGFRRQKTTIIVISAVTVFTFWRSLFLVEGLFDGFMEEGASLDLSMVLRLVAVMAIPVCECLVIMLLHQKVFPASCRKKRSKYLWAGAGQEGPLEFTYSSYKTGNRRVISKGILYIILLAITLYVGFHFSTLRKMRELDELLLDKIVSELERMAVPFDGGIVISIDDHRTMEAGLIVSYHAKVNPSGETPCCALIRKHILIPWIQVNIEEIETGDKVKENQGVNRE